MTAAVDFDYKDNTSVSDVFYEPDIYNFIDNLNDWD